MTADCKRITKALLGALLAMMMLWTSLPALAAWTTEDVDTMLMESFDWSGVRWERTAYGRGAATDITEEATLDGHKYIFRAMSDGTGVAEVSLTGWFSDLKMNWDASFPRGLQAFTACIYAVDQLVPTRNASELLSPYDIYEVLQRGKFFDDTVASGWQVLEISRGRIEASHQCGAYMIISVNGSQFSFLYTST